MVWLQAKVVGQVDRIFPAWYRHCCEIVFEAQADFFEQISWKCAAFEEQSSET